VVAEGIPRLVGIEAEVSYLEGHISGSPSPSKTSRLVETEGGIAGVDAGEGVEVAGAGVGRGGGKQKSTLSPHIQKDNVPACMLIFAPAVARNGRPKIIGMWGLSSMSITKKSQRITNSPTLTGRSSRKPTGCRMEQSAN